MTNEELQAIRARTDAATKGPFEAWGNYGGFDVVRVYLDQPMETLCELEFKRDAVFIAHAREDMLTLLAEVDMLRSVRAFDAALAPQDTAVILALQAENDQLRAALERVSKIYPTPYVERICTVALGLTPPKAE